MKRQEKFPDTSTFRFYNANPKNRFGGDCVIRAIAAALNQSWEQTVRELTEVGLKYGYVLNDEHAFERYLKNKGWIKHKQPRKSDNTRYRGYEFCKLLQLRGKTENIIANIGSHHVVAIIDGKINDIVNSTDGCIGNFWTYGGE